VLTNHYKSILVTGGTGYIGSHTCAALLEKGYRTVIYDNLSNSYAEVLLSLRKITGRTPDFVEGSLLNRALLEATLAEYQCDAVIHFAGLKSIGASIEMPLDYYENNVMGTLSLLQAMDTIGLNTLVFSSSATVYGIPQSLPLGEAHPLSAVNPYGRTKIIIEDMLRDLFRSSPTWKIAILRYFNPVGAHESGAMGEAPRDTPNNLMPYISEVAAGRLKALRIWGNDYPTPDGTGVRDYIHVVDLAKGHLAALLHLSAPTCSEINLGTGRGTSVLELVRSFERASGRTIPIEFGPRREGDVASCYADPSLAKTLLGWRAERDINAMCRDTWHWQTRRPWEFNGQPADAAISLIAHRCNLPAKHQRFQPPLGPFL
jgi:UDP-glucose 4-epimerase